MIENIKIKTLSDLGNFITTAIADGDWRSRIDSLPTLDVELISDEEIEKIIFRIEDDPEATASTEDQRLAWALVEAILKDKVDSWYIIGRIARANKNAA